jgi:hypothetical protein
MTANYFLLLENAKVSGSAIAFKRTGSDTVTSKGQIVATGVFDGAEITFVTVEGTEELPIYDGTDILTITATSKRNYYISLYSGEQIKAIVSSAGSNTSLTVKLYEMRG